MGGSWSMGWALWLVTAHALQQEVSRPELCAHSEQVVVAKVGEMRAERLPDGTIQRRVQVTVDEVVKGPDTVQRELVLPGGQIDDQVYWVSDVPNLLSGATYLLFLAVQDGEWQVQGGEQGAIRITPAGARRGETLAQALTSVGSCHE